MTKEQILERNRKYDRERAKTPEYQKRVKAYKSSDHHKKLAKGYYLKRMQREEAREKNRQRVRKWVMENPDRAKQMHRDYYLRNRERLMAYQKARLNDPKWRLIHRLRLRLTETLSAKNIKKAVSITKIVGCSGEFLKSYIESRFKPGMSWENRSEWHIDHRIPCASFDLSKPDQLRACFHYTNLQPLWRADNIRKSDSIPEPHQAEMI